MERTNEFSTEVKRLLLNLDSDSPKVISDAVDALEKLGSTDPRLILALRERVQKKGEWSIWTRKYVIDLVEKLSRRSEKEDIQRFKDFIMSDEMPDRDLIVRLIRFQLETNRRQRMNIAVITFSLLYIALGIVINSIK